MHRIHVSSTAIRAIGYDEKKRILEVEYVGGGTYRYFEVPPHVFLGLYDAESKGAYYDEHVKKPGYQFDRVK